MVDPEKIIRSLISSNLGKKKKNKSSGLGGMLNGKTLLLGLGAAGAAYMAHKHMTGGASAVGAAPPSLPPPAPLPPPAMSSSASTLPPPPSAPAAVAPPRPIAAAANTSLFLVRAMIAAAHADHDIDAEERRRILAKTEVFTLDPEERALLERELDRPMSLFDVIDESRRLGVPGRQVYAASFLAITADTEAERAYLKRLAAGIGLAEHEAQELQELLG